MTQLSRTQQTSAQLAWKRRSEPPTLADLKARLKAQGRESLIEAAMAQEHLDGISKRIKSLREQTRLRQYEVAHQINEAPRTYQSWENGEVETNRDNYGKIAKFFSRTLKREVTTNWILHGSDEAPESPDLIGGLAASAQLDRIEDKLDWIIDRLLAGDAGVALDELGAWAEARDQAAARKRRDAAQAPTRRQAS